MRYLFLIILPILFISCNIKNGLEDTKAIFLKERYDIGIVVSDFYSQEKIKEITLKDVTDQAGKKSTENIPSELSTAFVNRVRKFLKEKGFERINKSFKNRVVLIYFSKTDGVAYVPDNLLGPDAYNTFSDITKIENYWFYFRDKISY